MVTDTELPDRGVVFWPVGNGDATTVVVDDDTVVQNDLRDLKSADDDGAVVAAVIDALAATLPPTGRGGRPRLAVAAFSHHDKDHCAGAPRFFKEIHSDELWVTPRMWHEQADDDAEDFGEDAQALFDEANRRVAATLAAADGDPGDGHRIRIIGEHPDEARYAYAALPARWRHRVGEAVPLGTGEHAEALVLGPDGTDCSRTDGAGRNASSMLLRIRLICEGGADAGLLLVGDADHTVLERMFEQAKIADRDLSWQVGLVAHHCSHHAVVDATDEPAEFVLAEMAATAAPGARLVASSRAFQSRDVSGQDPPHRRARELYQDRIPAIDAVICTAEHPNTDDPRPVVFALSNDGVLELVDPQAAQDESARAEAKALELTAAAARPRRLARLAAVSSVPPHRRRAPRVAPAAGSVHARDRRAPDPVGDAVTQARGGSNPRGGAGFG